MPKNRPTEVAYNAVRDDMQTYLDNAEPEQISLPQWGVTTWQNAHGERRASSRHTFHIGFRYMRDTGDYWTCILVDTRTEGSLPVAGTFINWGTNPPTPREVLLLYQNARFPLSRDFKPSRSGSGGGQGGAGGAGGSSSGGASGWKKEIHEDGYGGYFYYDADWEYHQCDRNGNDTYTTQAGGYRTSNPHSFKAVFGPPPNTYYYHRGRRMPCKLNTDKRNQTWFEDAQKRTWNAKYYASEPRHSQSSSSASHRSATTASQSQGGHKTSTQRKYFTDEESGKRYYVDSAGKTRWV
ncbi:uncharacterized protein B0T15DRAFT_546014 [Chaetomium strumarium]|uniref:Uncharacterized protein n=1 Tax=Chaetomium strumarium TaxID=1170767 RepID=A0AAJ0H118_9PEZI|nr:hypothetical protein B0T15DRAFT_546014 [Chaetomium strumarium]